MTIDFKEIKECPECKMEAKLKDWTFVEETSQGLIFSCVFCGEKMTPAQMD